MPRWLLSVTMLWFAVGTVRPLCAEDAAGIAFFEKQVRPLLVKHCYKCHSNSAEHRGDLFLDSKAGWAEGGQSGPAVVPGKPNESLLIQAVRHESLEMPPDGKLSADEITVLVKWVTLGAPDPRVGRDAPAVKKGIDVEKGRQHWAFQPPKRHSVPSIKDEAWPRGDVDRFILARLEHAGIKPVADADRLALLRRATFDLIGLPPTPAEMEAFLKDKSDAAFANVVDRLLASRHFGERWGRHWFDVARFAEADGDFFVESWRYRDYVIRSFNADKPYDQFVLEQFAGDLLPARDADERDEHTVATGFLALGPNYFPESGPQAFMDVIDEQIDVTTRALLATTVACARCHDHKFDPIPTTDYYALAGILASSDIRKTTVFSKGKHTFVGLNLGLPLQGYDADIVERFSQLAKDRYLDGKAVVRLGWDLNKLVAAQKSAKSAAEKEKLDKEIAVLRAKIDGRQSQGQAARVELRDFPPLPPMAMGVIDRKQPTNVKVHIRGEPDNLGAEVPRGVIRVATTGEPPVIGPKDSGRLQFARWIASRDNPLTARVLVNRVWLHLFGEGLVRTVDDFGTMGERPSHPELLDHLAVRFMDDGWSIKRLIRELLLSRAYQLSVARDAAAEEIDADNRLLWRHHRRRLESEAIRDSILAFSGQLDLEPEQGSLIGDLGPGSLRFDGDEIHFNSLKRSVYLPQPRVKQPPLYQLFDHVDLSAVTGRRDTTTVPSQALFLLNSDFARQQARHAAERLLSGKGDATQRIDLAFRLAFGRPASKTDLATAREFLANYARTWQAEAAHAAREAAASSKPEPKLSKKQRKQQAAGSRAAANEQAEFARIAFNPRALELSAWTSLCQLLMASPEFVYVH